MSRRMIYYLATVMAIAVAAMVWVQLMTMRKTSLLHDRNFSISVNRALNDISDWIDYQEIELFYKYDAEHSAVDANSASDWNIYPNSDPSEP